MIDVTMSVRPEPGWYTAYSVGGVRYVVVVSQCTGSAWITTSDGPAKSIIYAYSAHKEPPWEKFELEPL